MRSGPSRSSIQRRSSASGGEWRRAAQVARFAHCDAAGVLSQSLFSCLSLSGFFDCLIRFQLAQVGFALHATVDCTAAHSTRTCVPAVHDSTRENGGAAQLSSIESDQPSALPSAPHWLQLQPLASAYPQRNRQLQVEAGLRLGLICIRVRWYLRSTRNASQLHSS